MTILPRGPFWGIVVGVALAIAGCSDPTSSGPPTATATIVVRTTTRGADIDPDGYFVTVDRAFASRIGANDVVRFSSLMPGAHDIEMTGVASNCRLSGFLDRDIGAGEEVTVDFDATCLPVAYILSTTSQGTGLRVVPPGETGFRPPVPFDGPLMSVAARSTASLAWVVGGWDVVAGIDLLTGVEEVRLSVPGNPSDITLSRDGRWAYVSTLSRPGVTVIDAEGTAVAGVIDIGVGVNRLDLSTDGTRLFLSTTKGELLVVDVQSGSVVARTMIGGQVLGVKADPRGGRVYVANTSANLVIVIDTDTGERIAAVPAGIRPSYLAITPDGSELYVADANGIVQIETGTLSSSGFPLPRTVVPTDLDITLDGSFLLLATTPGVMAIHRTSGAVMGLGGGSGVTRVISTR